MFVERIVRLVVDLFSFYRSEVCSEAVVVVLLPAIEGVVMAFRTLDADT